MLETRTSPACAFAATRAPIGTAIPLGFSHQLTLAGVETSTDLEPEFAHVPNQPACTLDRSARSVEGREKAIA